MVAATAATCQPSALEKLPTLANGKERSVGWEHVVVSCPESDEDGVLSWQRTTARWCETMIRSHSGESFQVFSLVRKPYATLTFHGDSRAETPRTRLRSSRRPRNTDGDIRCAAGAIAAAGRLRNNTDVMTSARPSPSLGQPRRNIRLWQLPHLVTSFGSAS